MPSVELLRYRYSRTNAFPRPDRRYRTARTCLDHGKLPSFHRDDKPTWKIWRYLQNREVVHDPAQRVRLLKKQRALSTAIRLHHGNMRRLRPIVEAYLLAGVDDKSLSMRMGASPQAIGWFRSAFYDVGHHRQYPHYVLLHLIRAIDDEGHTSLNPHRLWKLLAYTIGPDALDQLIHNPVADQLAFKTGGLAVWFTQKTEAVLQSKQLLAASNVNPGDQKHIALLLKFLHQSLHGQGKSDDRPLNQLEEIADAMLRELPWCKGPELTPGPVREWDEKAVELRDDELLLVAAGEKPPPELEEAMGLGFPTAQDVARKNSPRGRKGK